MQKVLDIKGKCNQPEGEWRSPVSGEGDASCILQSNYDIIRVLLLHECLHCALFLIIPQELKTG